MAKGQKQRSKKRKPGRSAAVSVSPERYLKLLERLLSAQASASEGNEVHWDFGRGERPQKIMAELAFVAKKEGIQLEMVMKDSSFRFVFPESEPAAQPFRVVRGDKLVTDGVLDPPLAQDAPS